MDFWLWKTAHVISAAILFGTGIGIAFFCWLGYRLAMQRNDIGALRAVLRLTVRADACFTAPAAAFQLISGLIMMHLLGWSYSGPWFMASLLLYLFVGACWLPVVWMQWWLARTAGEVADIAALPARFHRIFRYWFALGVPAFCAMLLLFYLMVTKPLAVAAG